MSVAETQPGSETTEGGQQELRASLVRAVEAKLGYEGYTNFEDVYLKDPEYLKHVYGTVQELIVAAGLNPQRALVAGLSHRDDHSADDKKYHRTLQAEPFNSVHGLGFYPSNDSEQDASAHAIARRNINNYRNQLHSLAVRANGLEHNGEMTESRRAQLKEKAATLNVHIDEQQARLNEPDIPVYYFTRPEGLLNNEPEDNPIAYADLAPEQAALGIYDLDALRTDGHKVTKKGDKQIRVYINGEELEQYRRALLHLRVHSEEEPKG